MLRNFFIDMCIVKIKINPTSGMLLKRETRGSSFLFFALTLNTTNNWNNCLLGTWPRRSAPSHPVIIFKRIYWKGFSGLTLTTNTYVYLHIYVGVKVDSQQKMIQWIQWCKSVTRERFYNSVNCSFRSDSSLLYSILTERSLRKGHVTMMKLSLN